MCIGVSDYVQKETANLCVSLAFYLDRKTDKQKNNLFRL